MTLFAAPLTAVPAGIVTPWVDPVIAIGSVAVKVPAVVTPSSMCELAVRVVADPANGM